MRINLNIVAKVREELIKKFPNCVISVSDTTNGDGEHSIDAVVYRNLEKYGFFTPREKDIFRRIVMKHTGDKYFFISCNIDNTPILGASAEVLV